MAKFKCVLYEARGQDWPDINKISTFQNGLNSTICSQLSQQLNLLRKYSDFVWVVQQLAGRSTAPSSSLFYALQDKGSGYNHNHNHYYSSKAMDIGNIEIAIIGGIQPTSSPSRAQSISPTQHKQYRKEGRCIQCGSQDH
jgi:hypothetical protein